MRRGNHRHGRRLRSEGRADDGADRTEMPGRGGGRHVAADMELRCQEDDPEEQCHKTDTLSPAMHVLIKTKLKADWLQGQVKYRQGTLFLSIACRLASRLVLALKLGFMKKQRAIFVCGDRRAAFAVLACAALLFFAAGGALLHEHSHGPDATCHVCQALHMPALAAARLNLSTVLERVAWYSSRPQHLALCEPFSLDRASRAPPIA